MTRSRKALNTLAMNLSAALLAGLMIPAVYAAEPQVTEGFINAPVAQVWRIFTTSEGFKATGVAHSEVDLRVGGSIRSHYDPKGTLGDPGTIVNEILAYEPERMLAIRIKEAPANFPYRNAMKSAWTVIYFTPSGEMTHLRIVGLGYQDDPESLEMRKFFERGNRYTIDHLAKPFWPKCAHCLKEEAEAAEHTH
jgi:uncharacterized protein YndB with AHSA1/START domain